MNEEERKQFDSLTSLRKELVEKTVPRRIEEAPKDGSEILLFSEEGIYQGYFCHQQNRFKPTYFGFHGCGCCSESEPVPTRFLPLPFLMGPK